MLCYMSNQQIVILSYSNFINNIVNLKIFNNSQNYNLNNLRFTIGKIFRGGKILKINNSILKLMNFSGLQIFFI